MIEKETVPPPTGEQGLANLAFVKIPYVVNGCLLFAAIAINFANVVARYFFFEAFYWAEEVLIYMIVWGVALAVASITYQGAHIKMDLFSSMFRSPFKQIVGGFTALLLLVCTIYAIVQSIKVVLLYAQTGNVSVAAHIPLTIPHVAVPIGFTLMAFAVVYRLRAYITGRFE